MNLKSALCLGISSLLILMSAIPALSGTNNNATSRKEGQTWQEFLNKHSDIYVEYKYSADKPLLRIAADTGESIKLPAGTPVVIRIIETIKSSDVTEGSSISFSVLQDVKVGNDVLIKAGSMGQAQIAVSEDAGRVGKAGKITITDFSVRAVDGAFVPLRGTISGKGTDKVVTSGALAWFICPLFLLMKGGDAVVPAGTEKTTYTGADVEVTITHQ